MRDFRALGYRRSVLLVLNRGLGWLTCSIYDSVQANITSSWEPSLTTSPLPPSLIPSPVWVWCPSGLPHSLFLLLSRCSVSRVDSLSVSLPLDCELPEFKDHVWLISGSQAPSTGLGTGKMLRDRWMNSVAQGASFWSCTGWALVFPTLDGGFAETSVSQSLHFLI